MKSIKFILLLLCFALFGCAKEPAPPDYTEQYKTMAERLEESYANGSVENYDISYDANSVTVTTWDKSLLMASVLVKSGEFADSWAAMVESQVTGCNDIMDLLKEAGVEDPNVTFEIRSDKPGEGAAMITVTNGKLTWDASDPSKSLH